jgi:hypothetical protein
MIGMDNLEHKNFYFEGVDYILGRPPEKVNYVGRHEPGWVLPSFIKPFEKKEFYNIWQSAIRVISETEELVITGYRFRPEDSYSFLLISMLPANCKIILVDREPADKIERLESIGFKIHKTYESLEKYLDS